MHVWYREYDIYKITAILKFETNVIANISVNPIWRAVIFVIMSVDTFKTDVVVFIGDVIMCFRSDWPINLRMWVTNWSNIFVDHGQFGDSLYQQHTSKGNCPICW
jgi:hypothetical protein